jgi:hypothetical protein
MANTGPGTAPRSSRYDAEAAALSLRSRLERSGARVVPKRVGQPGTFDRVQNPPQIRKPKRLFKEGPKVTGLRLVSPELPSGQCNRRNAQFGAVLTQIRP